MILRHGQGRKLEGRRQGLKKSRLAGRDGGGEDRVPDDMRSEASGGGEGEAQREEMRLLVMA